MYVQREPPDLPVYQVRHKFPIEASDGRNKIPFASPMLQARDTILCRHCGGQSIRSAAMPESRGEGEAKT